MSEYYAVVRSTDHLAHYGVKGMKWGVRKAIDKGNERKLARQFRKAAKKLEKLNDRADIEKQTQKAAKMNKISKVSRRVGHVGAAIGTAGFVTNMKADQKTLSTQKSKDYWNNRYTEKIAKAQREMDQLKAEDWKGWLNGDYKKHGISKAESKRRIKAFHKEIMDKYGEPARLRKEKAQLMEAYDKDLGRLGDAKKIGNIVGGIGAGIGAVGYGTAAIAKGKAVAAKRRTTSEGHAKAVAKRDAWKKEMKTAFSGTKYANVYNAPQKSKKTRRKKVTT